MDPLGITGIVIGVVLGVGVCIIIVIFIWRTLRRNVGKEGWTNFDSVRSNAALQHLDNESKSSYGTNTTPIQSAPQSPIAVEEKPSIEPVMSLRPGLAQVADPPDCVILEDSVTSFLQRRRSSLSSSEGQLGQIRPDLYQKKNSVVMQSVDSTLEMGRIQLFMQYSVHTSDFVLTLCQISDLPARLSMYSLTIDLCPAVDKKIRKTEPRKIQDELSCIFKFATTFEELTEKTVQIRLFDCAPRFSRSPQQLAMVEIDLFDFDPSGDIQVWADFEPKSQAAELGEVLFSLNFLPSNDRLAVTLHEAKNLKKMDITGNSDPYVRLTLLIGGKRVKRRRSATCKNTLNPVWGEALEFTIKEKQLEIAAIEIHVMDYDIISNDDLIGTILLSKDSTDARHRDVWNEMIGRKIVNNQWLTLRDAQYDNSTTSH